MSVMCQCCGLVPQSKAITLLACFRVTHHREINAFLMQCHTTATDTPWPLPPWMHALVPGYEGSEDEPDGP